MSRTAASAIRTSTKRATSGAAPRPSRCPWRPSRLVGGRKSLPGSVIGGIAETADATYERMLNGDVRYRFTIDMSTL